MKKNNNLRKKKKVIFLIEILVIVAICFLTRNCGNNNEYQTFNLNRIKYVIPKKCYNPETDSTYTSDHMFYVGNSQSEYVIYGSEISDFNEEDITYGLIRDKEALLALKSATSMDKVIEIVHDSTGLFSNVYESSVIEKPSYKMYAFSSKEQFKEGEYQAYTLFYVHGDVRYLQIFLHEEPELLTDADKEYMSLYTGLRK